MGATKDAKRLKLSEVTTLTKVPTLPISYGDAQPLLLALTGPLLPKAGAAAFRSLITSDPGQPKFA